MYLDGVSRNVHLPVAVDGGFVAAGRLGLGRIQAPRYHVKSDLEQGRLVSVFPTFHPAPTPLPRHQPSARQVLNPATINTNTIDKSNSAETSPTECVFWSSSSCPVRTKRVTAPQPRQSREG